MFKTFKFDYNHCEAGCSFRVDLEKFTPEMAKATLGFFLWKNGYDEENDPIDEVMKKYAMHVILIATKENLNEKGVIAHFENNEGFCKLDGSSGIELLSVQLYEFDENSLFLESEE